eukprot:77717_1
MNILHWEQYLGPLGKTKLNIKPDTFINIFKWNRLVLPVFQRKYCWTEKQLQRYWYDLLYVALSIGNLGHRKHRRRHDNAHSLGKIVTFEEPNMITVIDGQQRLTTTLIILTAIAQHLSKLNSANHSTKYKKLTAKIHNILFIDTVPDHVTYQEGDALEFVRFVPTYLDRRYFYDILLDNVPKDAEQIKSNHIYFAKTYFTEQLKTYADYTKLFLLYKHLLTQFKFVYVGIPKIDKSLACHSIYQWFFERELFIEQSGGDRPGYSQTVCDLFRNYSLSFFISECLAKQKQIYKLWIEVETSYQSIAAFNQHLIGLIDVSAMDVYKPYKLYRGLVDFIESKLKQYKENEYKIFMEQMLRRLKQNEQRNDVEIQTHLMLICGFVRHLDDVSDAIITEIVGVVSTYLPL